MADQNITKVKKYVGEMQAQGKSDAEIIEQLEKVGHSPEIILSALKTSRPTVNPASIYPSAQPMVFVSEQAVAASSVRSPTSTTSIILFVLMLLTFFTPLGAVLFLPMVIVGLVSAIKFVGDTKPSQSSTPLHPILQVLRVLMMTGLIFVLGIVAIIGFFFMALVTGVVDLDLGS